MQEQKAKRQAISLPVTKELKVTVIPNNNHEFLMPTKEVAAGYGVSSSTIRDHRKNYHGEFTEQKHYIKGVEISDTLPKGSQPHQIFWTKRGIVRLGFFIKSERAKLFRDWAEDLVINVAKSESAAMSGAFAKKGLPAKRKHNRLTPERLADLLADVCLIDNKDLRVSLTKKLTGRQ